MFMTVSQSYNVTQQQVIGMPTSFAGGFGGGAPQNFLTAAPINFGGGNMVNAPVNTPVAFGGGFNGVVPQPVSFGGVNFGGANLGGAGVFNANAQMAQQAQIAQMLQMASLQQTQQAGFMPTAWGGGFPAQTAGFLPVQAPVTSFAPMPGYFPVAQAPGFLPVVGGGGWDLGGGSWDLSPVSWGGGWDDLLGHCDDFDADKDSAAVNADGFKSVFTLTDDPHMSETVFDENGKQVAHSTGHSMGNDGGIYKVVDSGNFDINAQYSGKEGATYVRKAGGVLDGYYWELTKDGLLVDGKRIQDEQFTTADGSVFRNNGAETILVDAATGTEAKFNIINGDYINTSVITDERAQDLGGMFGRLAGDRNGTASSDDKHGVGFLRDGHDKNYKVASGDIHDEGELREPDPFTVGFQRVTVPAWQTAVPSWTTWSQTTTERRMFA